MIFISGVVKHRWWDSYDWYEGLTAFIPGFGVISDDDALLLQQHREAKGIMMEAYRFRAYSDQELVV